MEKDEKTMEMVEKTSELIYKTVMTSFEVVAKIAHLMDIPVHVLGDFYCEMFKDVIKDYEKFCADKEDEEKLDIE